MYLWCVLTTMFEMTRDFKKACRNSLEKFGETGATTYPGENYLDMESDIMAICKRLDVCGGLSDEDLECVFSGLAKTSHADMKKRMTQIAVMAELGDFTLLKTITATSSNLDKCAAAFDIATSYFDSQVKTSKWNVLNKKGRHIATNCWNCEKEDCNANTCPEPRDEEKYKRNKKKFYDARKAGKNGKKQSVVKDGDKKDSNKSGKGGYQRSQFSNNVVGKNGIVMVAGVPHLNCKKCNGLQPDHGSSTHDPWAAAAAAGTPYTLPPGHPLAVAKAANVAKATGSTVPTSSGTAASSIGADAAGGSPGISRSAFERNLNELERTSTDPNAAATCTLLRNLLLKR